MQLSMVTILCFAIKCFAQKSLMSHDENIVEKPGTMIRPNMKAEEILLNPNCVFDDTLCFLMIAYRK